MEGSCTSYNHWTSATSSPSSCVSSAGATLFTSLFTTLLTSECGLGNPDQYPADASSNLLGEYDFIVVGGGTAGSVVASRLSEVPEWNVLLIEAGDNPPLMSEIPAMGLGLLKSDMDWEFRTEPQNKSCQGLRDQRCNLASGRALGGSSAMNGMLYIRGMKQDFDQWAAAGNDGWSYDEVLSYFMKSEDLRPTKNENDKQFSYHGSGGPLTVQRFESLDLASTLLRAVKEAGHNELDDINGPSQLGFAHLHGTIRNGTRCSAAKAFLGPAKSRTNLHVIKNSKVTRIIIDPITKQAETVEFSSRDDKIQQVRIKKEVILSAGTINSPKLLMLSGIGPKAHLKEFGIKVIKDLRVGENLQDHFLFLGSLCSISSSEKVKSNPLSSLDVSYEYLTRRTGALASSYAITVSGFIKTKYALEDRPDIQFLFFGVLANDTNGSAMFGKAFGLTNETIISLQEMLKEHDVVLMVPLLSRPSSRGKILLRSSCPSDYPKIYAGYLNSTEDVETLLEGINATVGIMETEAMRSRNATRRKLFVKSCEGLDFDTEEYWKCMVRNVGTTSFHLVGTCKMGPSSDPEAVVDPKLKVHGVKGIRVADASMMPRIVGTPTYATTIMIGEKAADMIKTEWPNDS